MSVNIFMDVDLSGIVLITVYLSVREMLLTKQGRHCPGNQRKTGESEKD